MLYSAISADIDILIADNKDFSAVEVEKPEILTPSQFNEKYLSMEITAAYFVLLPYNSLVCKKSPHALYQNMRTSLVSPAGFEPTTF